MYRGLSHKGTTCYRHSNFFMVTKDKGGRGGVPERKAVEDQKKEALHTRTLTVQLPKRGKFQRGEVLQRERRG